MGAGPVGLQQEISLAHLIDPQRKWYNNKRLIILHAWIIFILVTSSTNGYDGSMMNGLQSLSQWESAFNKPSGGKLGLLNAIQAKYWWVGRLSICPLRVRWHWSPSGRVVRCGYHVHRYCRSNCFSIRRHVHWCSFLDWFWPHFRSHAAPMLVTEIISYPVYRAPLTSLYNSLWYTGSIIAAWTTYSTFKMNSTGAWRLPSLLRGLPAILQLVFVWFVPESPSWLVSKGREDEALKILAYYHADGDTSDPLVQHEFQEIKAALEFDRTVAANVDWKSFIATPGNRKRMRIIVAIAFFSQWSGNGLVLCYLNQVFDQIGITSPDTRLLINGILQIWNLFWAVFAAFRVNHLGRHFLFLLSAGLMLLFYTAQTICFSEYAQHGTAAAGHAVIAFIFLFYAAYDIAFTPLIVSYTIEILPYHLRAKGFNIFNFVISVAVIFNQYVNPIALDVIGWKYCLVYVCWLAFEFVYLWFFLVETKHRTLEETAALFDGEDAIGKITHHAKMHETREKFEKQDA